LAGLESFNLRVLDELFSSDGEVMVQTDEGEDLPLRLDILGFSFAD
jgi:hypothetical protein